jgi:hypothetical protein
MFIPLAQALVNGSEKMDLTKHDNVFQMPIAVPIVAINIG